MLDAFRFLRRVAGNARKGGRLGMGCRLSLGDRRISLQDKTGDRPVEGEIGDGEADQKGGNSTDRFDCGQTGACHSEQEAEKGPNRCAEDEARYRRYEEKHDPGF